MRVEPNPIKRQFQIFPTELYEQDVKKINSTVTELISDCMNVDEKYISLALEPVESEKWDKTVVEPEITGKKQMLFKEPDYS